MAENKKGVKPFKEQGVAGFSVVGGYLQTNERDARATNTSTRWAIAADILANISLVAASTRFYLNLLASPVWSADPVDESTAAREAADFVEDVMNNTSHSWTRIVRRKGLGKFHGFAISEWVAKRRPDGKIGMDIESRPQHTIERWEIQPNGSIDGVYQRSPQTGEELYIPRKKFIYYVDDALTDSPEGMGWYRHLIEPAQRLRTYLRLEKIGYERDLAGIPVIRMPTTKLNEAVEAGKLTAAQATAATQGAEDFVKLESKTSETGLLVDSLPYMAQTGDGEAPSGVPQWDIELLTSDAGAMPQMLESIKRLNTEMALIIGTENILTGTDGAGSLALSQDKSNNLYMNVSSMLTELVEIFNKDFLDPLWKLNGFNDDLKPKLITEDVSFKDVESMAAVIRDMATAGAVLTPDDPAIDDMRILLGLPPQPEIDMGMMPVGVPPMQTEDEDEEMEEDDEEMED